MKKVALILVISFLLLTMFSATVLAAGDQVHGEKGEGPTEQHCINFGECPYGE